MCFNNEKKFIEAFKSVMETSGKVQFCKVKNCLRDDARAILIVVVLKNSEGKSIFAEL